jgi:predicted cupin superfamily sugar epimerase
MIYAHNSLPAIALQTLAALLLLTGSFTAVADSDRPSADELIQSLGLEGHVEGGYYRRTYEATDIARLPTQDGERFSMTSIYYLLTAAGPIGHFHRNRSDIVHYYHLGDPIEYVLIHPNGELQTVVMGPDPRLGQQLQMTVVGGTWTDQRGSKPRVRLPRYDPGCHIKDARGISPASRLHRGVESNRINVAVASQAAPCALVFPHEK